MSSVVTVLAYAALACVIVSLWTPKLYPLRDPSKAKAAGFYLVIFLLLFVLSAATAPSEPQDPANTASSASGAVEPQPFAPLEWTEVSRQVVAMPSTGRDRVMITIVASPNQERSGQQELLRAATSTAEAAHRDTGAPVVAVSLICQEAESSLGEPLLAHVVYIPDGRGIDGTTQDKPAWETLRAAPRGFSALELLYLQHWAELFPRYQSATGTDTQALDRTISNRLGVPAGSLQPFGNKLEDVPPDRQ